MKLQSSTPIRRALATVLAVGAMSTMIWAAPSALAQKGENLSEKVGPAAKERLANGAPLSFADLVETVSPAVVSVLVERDMSEEARQAFQFRGLPEEFRRRMLPEGAQPPVARSAGSGFIIDKTGYIVTNNHVVENGDTISVQLSNGDSIDAKLIGRDPSTDIALLKIESKDPLPYVPFATDDNLRVGDWVVAVGNPFGLGGSVTAGIVSARGREMNDQIGTYTDFIQIDASINRGNSGGPTFDLNGNVVGINTLIISPTGGNVGIGFAIPASTATSIVEQLKANGEIVRGYLGVNIQLITDDIAEGMGLTGTAGALVAEVSPDSPADKAGFASGDVILEVDGQEAKDYRHVTRLVGALAPGDKVSFKVIRDGKERTIKAKIGKRDVNIAAVGQNQETAPDAEAEALGLRLGALTDDARRSIDADESLNGVLIMEVDPMSEAAQKGLRPGNVILKVGGANVSSPEDVSKAIGGAKNGGSKSVLFFVHTGQTRRFVALNVGGE